MMANVNLEDSDENGWDMPWGESSESTWPEQLDSDGWKKNSRTNNLHYLEIFCFHDEIHICFRQIVY